MMKSLLLAATAASLLATGCIKQDEAPDALKSAIPTSDQVAIKLPNATAKSIGQLANWYVATRDVTRTFNGGSAWVLITIHTIVQFPVTSVDGDVYTWGPWSGALDPAEYKLDVTANADGTFDYSLKGRSKTVAGSSFEEVISGHADPRPGELKGNGTFSIDFDASRRVNPVDSGDAHGVVNAGYDLAAKHLDLDIATTDVGGQPVDDTYAYDETADGGGSMTLTFQGDAGGVAALENAELHSRWLANGSGRADGRISGGDLGTTVVMASECWDTMFGRSFYTDSQDFAPTEGDAGSCAFATAELP
jgi:hypothetical protein